MRKRAHARPQPGLDYLAGFMHSLAEDRARLAEIRAAYDQLSLLGQLLSAGTDISAMRGEFNRQADILLEQLVREQHKKALLHLGAAAGIAVDVLTRNLFERTADIGFLATDSEIRRFAEAGCDDPARTSDPFASMKLLSRFTEYVEKYSVYHNIMLLSPSGEVLLQLDGNNPVSASQDQLIGEALTTDAGYVEIFRPSDLLPGDPSPLIYAYRVMSEDGTRPVAILCLCFRFQDECRRIFDSLVAPDDWTVITLLDATGRVIASSDTNQFPLGVTLEAVADDACRIVRFAGREYLATTRRTHGYQGYRVPGWVAHALTPLNHAFESSGCEELAMVPDDFLAGVLETSTLFSPELKAIPREAARIQDELNRSVWNGHVWLCRDPDAAQNAGFAKILLREIGHTGEHTRTVFASAIANLYKAVISSTLFDCGTQAALAIDILDRNLYERANDCRWWALTPCFREILAQPGNIDAGQRARLTDVLRRINALYTVYSNLMLFDGSGKVVAVSNPADNDWLGRRLEAAWVRPTLNLADTQHYTQSAFEPSPLYDGRPTYIHAATVRAPDSNEPVGGIAIVFDAEPQFRAMLDDILPRQTDGSPVPDTFAVFAGRDGRVMATTAPHIETGTPLLIGSEFFNLGRGESFTNIVIFDGRYYAVGSTMSAGYREYRSGETAQRDDVLALVFRPLSAGIVDGERLARQRMPVAQQTAAKRQTGANGVDIACFHIAGNWYGIRAEQVIEAVACEHLTPLPEHGNNLCGCLMYRGEALSVIDPAPLLASRTPSPERRRAGDRGQRQIVVLESGRNGPRFGILIDQLAAVSEIPAGRIEALPEMMSDGTSLIDALVKPIDEAGERRILILLSPERMLRRLGCLPTPSAWQPDTQTAR